MKNWKSFTQARTFARGLGLRNWHAWMKTPRPEDIPSEPFHVYKLEWQGWRDWLGTEFRSFEDARTFVRNLKLETYEQWQKYCKSGKKPRNIPNCPMSVYKGQYKGISDWLGNQWMPFESARSYVWSLNLTGQIRWKKYCKSGSKPDDIPVTPNVVYKGQWVSWPDWVGTVRTRKARKSHVKT